jgi:hypothetical protein
VAIKNHKKENLMDYEISKLQSVMFLDEKLVWGTESRVNTQAMVGHGWFKMKVYFTNQRILWGLGTIHSGDLRYSEITRMSNSSSGSGGVAGVTANAKGGGCIDMVSTRVQLSLQFQDKETINYANWIINEVTKGSGLKPAQGVPDVSGTLDPNAAPLPPRNKGGCFIATAAYGYENHLNVTILRSFRDQILLNTSPGRTFVKIYEAFSPPVAQIISTSPKAKKVTRIFLKPLIYFIRLMSKNNNNL